MAIKRSIKSKVNATSTENEAALTALRIAELKVNPVKGHFDATHLREINRRILQDIPSYNGGQYRLTTGEHVRSRSIQNGADSYVVHYKHGGVADKDINQAIAKIGSIKELSQLPQAEASKRMATLYGDLDHIHPFNEANSRTLRVFTEQIAKEGGLKLDWTKTNANLNARDTLYMARDLEVSKRSYPNLTIDKMREATPSHYEAYDTQKKLSQAKSLEQLFKENLSTSIQINRSPYEAGKVSSNATLNSPELAKPVERKSNTSILRK